MLNPNCSEAVFRLGGKRYSVHSDYGEDLEEFLNKMFDNPIEDPFSSYEVVENNGGGANFILIEASLCFVSLWARNKIHMEKREAIDFLLQKSNQEILTFLLAYRDDELVGEKILELMSVVQTVRALESMWKSDGESLDLDEVIGK